MHGTADQIIPVDAAHWLDQHLPESQLITYEGLGHALVPMPLSRLCRRRNVSGVKYRIVGWLNRSVIPTETRSISSQIFCSVPLRIRGL